MEADPKFRELFIAALREHGEHPVVIETNVTNLIGIIGTLQLALRHPQFPEHTRGLVQRFIAGAMESAKRISPTIAEGLRLGNDPRYDVGRG